MAALLRLPDWHEQSGTNCSNEPAPATTTRAQDDAYSVRRFASPPCPPSAQAARARIGRNLDDVVLPFGSVACVDGTGRPSLCDDAPVVDAPPLARGCPMGLSTRVCDWARRLGIGVIPDSHIEPYPSLSRCHRLSRRVGPVSWQAHWQRTSGYPAFRHWRGDRGKSRHWPARGCSSSRLRAYCFVSSPALDGHRLRVRLLNRHGFLFHGATICMRCQCPRARSGRPDEESCLLSQTACAAKGLATGDRRGRRQRTGASAIDGGREGRTSSPGSECRSKNGIAEA